MINTKLFKQTVFAATIALLSFSACKKSDAPPPKPMQLIEYNNGTDVTRFDYNTDGSLKTIVFAKDPISMDNNVTYTASYLANKKIDELNGSNGSKIKLVYVNGILSRAEAFDGAVKTAQTDYAYNGTVLRSSTISMVNNNTAVPFFKGEFTFNSAGNITRSNSFVYNPFTNTLEASGYVNNLYDSKINPFASLGDVALVFWQVAPKNNVTRSEYFDANNAAQEVVETTYTYNGQGYPTGGTVRETQPGQQPTTALISFIYK